jgi:hypothetical protein
MPLMISAPYTTNSTSANAQTVSEQSAQPLLLSAPLLASADPLVDCARLLVLPLVEEQLAVLSGGLHGLHLLAVLLSHSWPRVALRLLLHLHQRLHVRHTAAARPSVRIDRLGGSRGRAVCVVMVMVRMLMVVLMPVGVRMRVRRSSRRGGGGLRRRLLLLPLLLLLVLLDALILLLQIVLLVLCSLLFLLLSFLALLLRCHRIPATVVHTAQVKNGASRPRQAGAR